MNIIVCIKQVPDAAKVEVDPVTGVLLRDGIESKLNPYDLFAIETALRLREEYGGSVTCLSMGPPQAARAIEEACYMGADRGFLLSDRGFAGADVVATSFTLAQGAGKIPGWDLIICGKQTTDGDTAQVGPEMAEFLDIPHAANVSGIVGVSQSAITVNMTADERVELIEIELPCLITVEKNIYTPRLPSYKRLTKLRDDKSRMVTVLSMNDLDIADENRYGLKGSPTQVERIFSPEAAGERQMFSGDGEHLAGVIYDALAERKFLGV